MYDWWHCLCQIITEHMICLLFDDKVMRFIYLRVDADTEKLLNIDDNVYVRLLLSTWYAYFLMTKSWDSFIFELMQTTEKLLNIYFLIYWYQLMTMFMSDWYAYFLMTKSWDLFSFELMQTTEMLLNLRFALHGTGTNVQVHVELILRWGCHWLLYILMKSSLN